MGWIRSVRIKATNRLVPTISDFFSRHVGLLAAYMYVHKHVHTCTRWAKFSHLKVLVGSHWVPVQRVSQINLHVDFNQCGLFGPVLTVKNSFFWEKNVFWCFHVGWSLLKINFFLNDFSNCNGTVKKRIFSKMHRDCCVFSSLFHYKPNSKAKFFGIFGMARNVFLEREWSACKNRQCRVEPDEAVEAKAKSEKSFFWR